MSTGRRRLRAGTTSAANPRLLNDPPARSHPRRVTNSHTMGSTPMPPFTRPDACSAAFVFAPRRRLRSSDPPAAALPTSLSHGAHGRVAQPLSGQTTAPAGNRRPSPRPLNRVLPQCTLGARPAGTVQAQAAAQSTFRLRARTTSHHRGGASGPKPRAPQGSVWEFGSAPIADPYPSGARFRRGSRDAVQYRKTRLGTFACTELP